jgi:hypothetical protein
LTIENGLMRVWVIALPIGLLKNITYINDKRVVLINVVEYMGHDKPIALAFRMQSGKGKFS